MEARQNAGTMKIRGSLYIFQGFDDAYQAEQIERHDLQADSIFVRINIKNQEILQENNLVTFEHQNQMIILGGDRNDILKYDIE